MSFMAGGRETERRKRWAKAFPNSFRSLFYQYKEFYKSTPQTIYDMIDGIAYMALRRIDDGDTNRG